jgi:hypothetical protein
MIETVYCLCKADSWEDIIKSMDNILHYKTITNLEV